MNIDESVLAKLSPQQRNELIALLEEYEYRKSGRMIETLFPDEGEFSRDKYPKHMELFKAGAKYMERCFMAANRVGKALAHGTRVVVPGGFKYIEDIKVGDTVFAWGGVPAKVTGVFPQPPKTLYTIYFSRGRSIRADGDHLWPVYMSDGKMHIMSTLAIKSYMDKTSSPSCIPRIPLSSVPFDCGKEELDVEPLVNAVATRVRSPKNFGGFLPKKFPPEVMRLRPSLRAELLSMFAKSVGKKRGTSVLFQGLDEELATQVRWLAISLGCDIWDIPSGLVVSPSKHVTSLLSYVRPPKQDRATLRIHKIEEGGIGLSTCIEVDHRSHMYVIEYGLMTHNTIAGAYEMTLHLTGEYPSWWEGARFDGPTKCWAAGKTNETTRDIIQMKLFGPIKWYGQKKGVAGTGVVPRDAIIQESITWKSGVSNLIDTVHIKHVSGGVSELGLKSYEQGRGSFEGTERHFIWFDEEPPLDVYSEALIRTATTGGKVLMTFTPLDGLSDVVLEFLPEMRVQSARGESDQV